MIRKNLEDWYGFVKSHDEHALSDMLANNVVFHSPVVHTPQEGKAITFLYLAAAGKVLAGDNFRYVGEWLSENGAVLEFNTIIDGVMIDGVDMITWGEDGKIVEFKVMIRPLKAVNKVHEMMREMLVQIG